MTAAGYPDATIQLASTGTSSGNYFISLPEITIAQETTLISDLKTSLNSTPTASDFTTTFRGGCFPDGTLRNYRSNCGSNLYYDLYFFCFRKMPRPFRWGVCAIIALLHDLLVVIGIFSILGMDAQCPGRRLVYHRCFLRSPAIVCMTPSSSSTESGKICSR